MKLEYKEAQMDSNLVLL